MKLAEALVNRADAQKRIEQIKQRLSNSAKVQEGEKPPEEPNDLLIELERTLNELESLIKRINKTNSSTEFEAGKSLSDALAERDVLAVKRSALRGLLEAASIQQSRYTRSEVKFLSTVDVAAVQKQVDDIAKQYRELDTKIQTINWQTELI